MYAWTWYIICVRVIVVYYNEIVTVRCQGTFGGERCWVKCEQLSLGLWTTSSGLAWLLMRAHRNGDRAGVSRCSEGDCEGRIRKVPQEERSPSSYMPQNVCIIVKRISTLLQVLLEKNNIWDSHCFTLLMYIHTYAFSCQQICLFSHVQNMSHNNRCLFSQVNNKPWIPWVYTWSWHRCEQVQIQQIQPGELMLVRLCL
jgi:hypothetical protein